MLQRGGPTWWTLLACLLLQASSGVVGQDICGDGMIAANSTKECEDGNIINGDGCSDNCIFELACPTCDPILLDLNVPDAATLNNTQEYSNLSQVVFLLESNESNFLVTADGEDWVNITIVILETQPDVSDSVDAYTIQAATVNRLPQDFNLLVARIILTGDQFPEGVEGRNVSSGMLLMENTNALNVHGDRNGEFSFAELQYVLPSIGYVVDQHPGYDPRDVCIIANDGVYETTACVSLFFIGYNDDPPTVSYTSSSVAVFVEGQVAAVGVVIGSLVVADPDHPTRYLIQSAELFVDAFIPQARETLSINTFSSSLTSSFNSTSGILTVIGAATSVEYSQYLSNVAYHNNMTEPDGDSRRIGVSVFDGIFTSNIAYISVMIQNTNDIPVVSLNGETPVINEFNVNYTEGSGQQVILPNITVIDTDPAPMITRLVVELLNAQDGENGDLERLAIGDSKALSVSSSALQHVVVLSGTARPTNYTEVLRTLTYENSEANPGSPSSATRMIRFIAEDTNNTNSTPSIANLAIIPVNDAPILLFVPAQDIPPSGSILTTGDMTVSFNYTEDDAPVSFGRDVYLRDVDGPIQSVTVELSGLLDGAMDDVSYSSSLVEMYGINETTSDFGQSRQLVFQGTAIAEDYEQILQSLSYQNLFRNNSVTDGQRNISITALDTAAGTSNTIHAYVTVMDRNDGPFVNLGTGIDMDRTIVYVEGSRSELLGLTYLADIMDEEGHNILSLNARLISTNGILDDRDIVFPQSLFILPFLNHPNTIAQSKEFHIEGNFTTEEFINALTSLRFVNEENEPTILNATGANLTREVIITVTDINLSSTQVRVNIRIEPINDNAPRIRLVTDPASCSQDYADVSLVRSRRETRLSAKQRRKRNMQSHHQTESTNTISPQIESALAYVSTNGHLEKIHLGFNTKTSVPPVEIQHDFDILLYFDPPELSRVPHRGFWESYSDLKVEFDEHVKWSDLMMRWKRIFVVFDIVRGPCNETTPCNAGLCFVNATGCPFSGYHQVKVALTSNSSSPGGWNEEEDSLMYFHACATTVMFIFLSVPLLLLCIYLTSHRKRMASLDDTLSKPVKPVTSLGPQTVAINITPSKCNVAATEVSKSVEKGTLPDAILVKSSPTSTQQLNQDSGGTRSTRRNHTHQDKRGRGHGPLPVQSTSSVHAPPVYGSWHSTDEPGSAADGLVPQLKERDKEVEEEEEQGGINEGASSNSCRRQPECHLHSMQELSRVVPHQAKCPHGPASRSRVKSRPHDPKAADDAVHRTVVDYSGTLHSDRPLAHHTQPAQQH